VPPKLEVEASGIGQAESRNKDKSNKRDPSSRFLFEQFFPGHFTRLLIGRVKML
jgi:hypothetical protein